MHCTAREKNSQNCLSLQFMCLEPVLESLVCEQSLRKTSQVVPTYFDRLFHFDDSYFGTVWKSPMLYENRFFDQRIEIINNIPHAHHSGDHYCSPGLTK